MSWIVSTRMDDCSVAAIIIAFIGTPSKITSLTYVMHRRYSAMCVSKALSKSLIVSMVVEQANNISTKYSLKYKTKWE